MSVAPLSSGAWLAAAAGSALIFGLAGWWMKVSQARGGDSPSLLLGLYLTGTAGFVLQTVLEGSLSFLADWRCWAAGIIIGAGSAWGNAVFMEALRWGPASLTSPVTNLNIVLVIAVSVGLYGERITPMEAVGIVLLLAAAVLIVRRGKGAAAPIHPRWYAYAGAAVVLFTFRNGGLKVTDELSIPGAPVLLVGYALSLLWFLAPVLRRLGAADAGIGAAAGKGSGSAAAQPPAPSPSAAGTGSPAGAGQAPDAAAARRTGLRFGLLAGLFSYGGMQLYAFALATGEAHLAAPIFATNSLVVAVLAIIVYRERLTRSQWAAFLCLLAGLIVIRL